MYSTESKIRKPDLNWKQYGVNGVSDSFHFAFRYAFHLLLFGYKMQNYGEYTRWQNHRNTHTKKHNDNTEMKKIVKEKCFSIWLIRVGPGAVFVGYYCCSNAINVMCLLSKNRRKWIKYHFCLFCLHWYRNAQTIKQKPTLPPLSICFCVFVCMRVFVCANIFSWFVFQSSCVSI